MTTALTRTSFKERLRMAALAGTLAISAMLPVVPGTLASTDTVAPSAVEVTTDQFDIDSSAGLIGLQARVNAASEGANLRAAADHDAKVLAAVPDGTIVALRVDMVDTVYDPDGITRWWPVSVDGQDGWIAGAFLTDVDGVPETTVVSDGTAGAPGKDGTDGTSVTVTRTAYEDTGLMVAEISADGDGLVMRAEPDRSSEKVLSLSDGAIVDLRIDMLDTVYDSQGTRWWPVVFDGVEGWVSGFYLIEPGTTAEVATTSETATAIFAAGDSVRVDTPSGRGLVVRVGPAGDSERLTSLQEGQEVQIVEGPASHENSVNGWYLISTGDVTGYVDGDLLVLVTSAATTSPADASSSTTDGDFAVGSWAEIRTPDGDGVNLRAGASTNSDQSGFAPNQALVEILGGPENGWYEVRWDRQTGYIDGSQLIPAKSPTLVETEAETTDTDTSTDVTAPKAPEDAAFASGDYGKVDAGSGVGVNIRSDASQDSDRAGYLPEGSVVKITEGPETDDAGNSWYRITDGSQSGWVRGDLMIPTEAPAKAEEVATSAAETGKPAETASTEQDATSGFILPLSNFTFTQDYGCSALGFYTYDSSFGCSVHDGVDLATASGSPIHAVANGTVVASGWCDCGLGYYVEIDHGGGLHSVYGHMASQPYVAVGQSVAQGDVIGPVGSTGLSTGPHTHFMVRQDGVTQDPKNYLPPLR